MKIKNIFFLSLFFPLTVVAQPIDNASPVKFFSAQKNVSTDSSKNTVDTSHNQEVTDKKRKAYNLNEEAVQLVFKGNKKDGLVKLKEATELDPENTTVLYNLAGVELSNSNPKEAIILLRKAVELKPDDLAFLNRLAESHFADSDVKNAILNYEKIIAVDPNYGEVILHLGTLYGMIKELDKAEKVFRQAISLEKNNSKAHSGLGHILVMKKKYAEAVKVLGESQTLKADSETAIALGLAHEGLGQKKEALDSYKLATQLGSKDKNLQTRIDGLEKAIAK